MIVLKKIADMLGGQLSGDPEYPISTVNSLGRAGRSEIAFVAPGRDIGETIKAGALIIAQDSPIRYPNLIRVDHPQLAFAQLLNFFYPPKPMTVGIASTAQISESARLAKGVSVGHFSYIGPDCQIGEGSEIHAQVVIYHGVTIGEQCQIHAGVVIRENVEVGNRVIIQPGAVIGADGFGFTRPEGGSPIKIPQVGKVIIGDGCEIGANTCIDRSTIEETELKANVKLDNLIQIGHNVRIGRDTAISAQTGISGSTDIGEGVIMGGQVGIADHLKIADGVMIVAKTGIGGSIKEKTIVAGIPHQEFGRWKRNCAIFRNLEELKEKIKILEKKIKEWEEK